MHLLWQSNKIEAISVENNKLTVRSVGEPSQIFQNNGLFAHKNDSNSKLSPHKNFGSINQSEYKQSESNNFKNTVNNGHKGPKGREKLKYVAQPLGTDTRHESLTNCLITDKNANIQMENELNDPNRSNIYFSTRSIQTDLRDSECQTENFSPDFALKIGEDGQFSKKQIELSMMPENFSNEIDLTQDIETLNRIRINNQSLEKLQNAPNSEKLQNLRKIEKNEILYRQNFLKRYFKSRAKSSNKEILKKISELDENLKLQLAENEHNFASKIEERQKDSNLVPKKVFFISFSRSIQEIYN
ncbi:MAG: hypothetical protein MHPSP_000964 [Paramarteilia canceri]